MTDVIANAGTARLTGGRNISLDDYMKETREIVRAVAREEYKRSYEKDPAKFYAATRNRRARMKDAEGKITPEEWQSLKEFYDFTCLRCQKKEPEIKLTFDHVLPISSGGTNMISNAQPLCGPCNSWKRTKHIDYRPNFLRDRLE